MIDFGPILARLLHYAATTTLFGVSLFPLYAYASAESEASGHWRARLLLSTAIAALLSGVFWFAFSAANMAGSLSDLADAEVLWAVVRDTGFGIVWTGRMFLAVAVVFVTAVRLLRTTTVSRNLVTAILGAVLLASLAGVGHAQVEEGSESVVHVLSDAAHRLAAGAWLGGLVPLAYILLCYTKTSCEVEPIERILLRFSGVGYAAVATLVGTGLINGWFLVGSVSNLLGTPYGQTLLAKLVLFAGMVALAAANRFWLVPSISKMRPDASNRSLAWLGSLRNRVLGEQLLGALILLVVSLLGTMRPAIDQ
jgi:copper resistance protein D